MYGDLTEAVQREALFEKASDDQWQRGVHRHDQANAAGESNEKTGASRHLADFLPAYLEISLRGVWRTTAGE